MHPHGLGRPVTDVDVLTCSAVVLALCVWAFIATERGWGAEPGWLRDWATVPPFAFATWLTPAMLYAAVRNLQERGVTTTALITAVLTAAATVILCCILYGLIVGTDLLRT